MSENQTVSVKDRLPSWSISRDTMIMLSLIVVIQLGAYGLTQISTASPSPPPGVSPSSPSGGVALTGVIVAESIAVVLAFRVWKCLPDRLQDVVKWAAITVLFGGTSLWAAITARWAIIALLGLWILCTLFAWVTFKILNRWDLKWTFHNLIALLLGILGTTAISKVLEPAPIIIFLLGMLVWDRIAVDFSSWMTDLIDLSVQAGIPNYFVIPTGWRLEWDRFQKWMADMDGSERPDDVGSLIGLGDFVLPGMLTVSAAAAVDGSGQIIAVGCFIGTCVGMLSLQRELHQREKGKATPALPWLNTGAIAGFILGWAVSGVPLLVALGVQSP